MDGIILSHRGKRYLIKQVSLYNYSNEIELVFDSQEGKETGLIFCVPQSVLEKVASMARTMAPIIQPPVQPAPAVEKKTGAKAGKKK